LGDTKPIGVAYRDQDLDGSIITSPQLVLTAKKSVSLAIGRSEKTRKVEAKGAPTAAAVRKSAKTRKK
jgi:hypothetical protein